MKAYTMSEISANEIINDFNIKYPFDIYKFCQQLDIKIIEDDYSVDAYLFCENGTKAIAINRNITNVNRRKFIIAHELGHYFIHGREITFACLNINETFNRYRKIEETEREANEFASEILLPKKEIIKNLPDRTMNFLDIERIAQKFEVSLTFASIKAIENSKTENEVLLCYKNNALKWFATSSIYVNLSINSLPPMDTLIDRYFRENEIDNKQEVSKGKWRFTEKNTKEEIKVINRNEVLALITIE